MAPRYQIRIKDTAGAVQAITTDWLSLHIRHIVNGPDEATIILNGDDPAANEFVLDSQIEVWRSDPAASPAIPWYIEYEGFHRTPQRRRDAQGQNIFTSRSVGYEDLLNRRVAMNYAGSAQASKNDVAETVMKEFADEQAGPAATSPPRLGASGVTTGLTIQADAAAGPNWEGDRSFRNLLDIEQEIAIASNMAFEVVGTGAAAFQFNVKVAPFGDDRSIAGLVAATGLNGAGNRPVIFSDLVGNAEQPTYTNTREGEVTRAVVLGQGTGDSRLFSYGNLAPDPSSDSPWNQREATGQSAMDVGTTPLQDKVTAMVTEGREREVFSFKVIQTPSALYGRDYFLGDIITAVFGTIQADKIIASIDINVEKGASGEPSEVIDIELSDDIATLPLLATGDRSRLPIGPISQLTKRIRDLERIDWAAAGTGTTWENVIIVAKSGGDYNTIAAANAAVVAPAIDNRWLILIMTGDYDEAVTAQSWVTYAGIDKHAVRIMPTAASDAVTMVANSRLTNIRVEHDGAALKGIVIPDVADVELLNVDVYGGFTQSIETSGAGLMSHVVVVNDGVGGNSLFVVGGGVNTPFITDSLFIAAGGSTATRGDNDIRGGCAFYNCYFSGRSGMLANQATSAVYAQDCRFVNTGVGGSFNGGGEFNNCEFTAGLAPGGVGTGVNFARFNHCNFSGQAVVFSVADCQIRHCNNIGSLDANFPSGNCLVTNCDDLNMINVTFTGTLTIQESHILNINYTSGVQILDLNGNSYQKGGAFTTNANRTWQGDDVETRFYPVTGLGTGAYLLHGLQSVMELDAAETAYVNVELEADHVLLLDAFLVYFPTGTGVWDWTVDTEGGACGEDEALNTDTDTANAQAVIDDEYHCLSILAAFSPYLAGDFIGVEVTADALAGGTTKINVRGVQIQQLRST